MRATVTPMKLAIEVPVTNRPDAVLGKPKMSASHASTVFRLPVDSAEAATDRVREAGGSVLAEPFDVMESGRMAVVADPDDGRESAQRGDLVACIDAAIFGGVGHADHFFFGVELWCPANIANAITVLSPDYILSHFHLLRYIDLSPRSLGL